MMKAYLDNNVVCSIAKDDTETESDALNRLLIAQEQGKVDLVSSELTLREIERYSGLGRTLSERTFYLLKKVPVVPWDELREIRSEGNAITWTNSPIIERDELYRSLLGLNLETVDAQHVFVAAKQACDVFLTCDGGVLTRAASIRQLCQLSVQKPSDRERRTMVVSSPSAS